MTEPTQTELHIEDIKVHASGSHVRLALSSQGGDRRALFIPIDTLKDLIDSLIRAHLSASVTAAAPPTIPPEQDYNPPDVTVHVVDLALVKWESGGAAIRMKTVEGRELVAAFMPDKIRFLREILRKHFDGPDKPESPGEDAPPMGPSIFPGQAPAQEQFFLRDGSGTPIDPMEAVFPLLKRRHEDQFEFVGTGFFISDNGLFATARHVLDELKNDELPAGSSLFGLQCIGGDNVVLRPAINYAVHETADVGVGGLAAASDASGVLLRSRHLVLSSEQPSLGDWAFTYAYPHTTQRLEQVEFSPRYYHGRLEEEYPKGRDRVMLPGPCWRTSMVIHDGASGGPVFGRSGRVFGINSTGIRDMRMSYVSRIAELLEVRVNRVRLPGAKEARTISIKELADLGHVLMR